MEEVKMEPDNSGSQNTIRPNGSDCDPVHGSSQSAEGVSLEKNDGYESVETKSEGEEAVSEKTGKFHVDKSLIPAAQLNDIQEFSELEGLGLDVFNQEDFEQGVMAQVDQVLAAEEEERKQKIIEKQMKAVEDDIKLVKQEMLDIERILTSLSGGQSDYTKRRIDSVRRQKENKISHMKTLQAKKKSLLRKLPGASTEEEGEDCENFDLNQVLGLTAGPSKETEREKMIRLGEMTPFGTVVSKPTSSSTKKSSSLSLSQKSSFDQFFIDKDHSRISQNKPAAKVQSELNRKLERMKASLSEDSKKSEKKKKQEKSTSDEDKKPGKSKSKRKNLFGERDKRHSSDEYQPNEQELAMNSDLSDQEIREQIKKKNKSPKKGFGRPKKPPKYHETDSDSDDAGTPQKKRFSSEVRIKKVIDDGCEDDYDDRMREFNKAERERMQRVENKEESDEEDEELEGGLRVPGRIWSKLFKYQQTGVSWLWELHGQQAGGIVGDEMGLGKTIEMIAFLAALRHSRLKDKNFSYQGLGPTIIVCPTTVMYQWVKEFHTWWPLFRVAILHSSGSYTCSEAELVRSIVKDRGVLITSFNTFVIHQALLIKYNWHYVVLDEGHKIRNPDAQVTVAVKQFRTYHRIILSGSPIQNNLKELWSLFDFVFPGKLGTLPDFMAHFSVPIVQGGYSNASEVQVMTAYKCACVLRDTINPYLLRRMKADVKIDLPNKNEQVLFCRLTDEQRQVYMEYLQSRECQAILSGKFQVFAGLITLRKICNHPDLCTGGPRLYIGEEPGEDVDLQFGYKGRSGKMIVVESLLRLWKKQGHKALFFSQSRALLDIMEKFVQKEGYNYLRMDGGTAISGRQSLINRFNKDNSIYLFLLTTRVGGLGVNLIGANRVIIFDPDWNPSTDTQARERTWRIGQERQVTIYRLVTTGTIEEKIYHRQIFKQFLTNRVLKDPKQRRFFKSNDLYELFELGNADGREQTETGALFAGTGSEVKVSSLMSQSKSRVKDDRVKKSSKVSKNRFDVMLEEKEREKKEQERRKEEEERERREMEVRMESGDSEDEVEGMYALAEKIRQEIKQEEEEEGGSGASDWSVKNRGGRTSSTEEVTVKREPSFDNIDSKPNSSGSDSRPGSGSGPGPADQNGNPDNRGGQAQSQILEQILKRKHDLQKKFGTDGTHRTHRDRESGREKHRNEEEEATSTSASSSHRKHRHKEHGEEGTHSQGLDEDHKRRHKKHGHKEHREGASHSQGLDEDHKRRHKHRHKDDRKGSGDEERHHHGRRKHKKRKHRDAKFEGERIPNLVKLDEYKTELSKEKEEDGKRMDDYVLKTLFKKTGIQSALKHDVIMDSSKHDYMIVEVEADRVAKEAMKALKRSRSQCSSAISGVPTWTGQSGAIKKPRFGLKKNSLLIEKSTKPDASKPVQLKKSESSGSSSTATSSTATSSTATSGPPSKHHFDGSLAGNVVKDIATGSSEASMMTSGELLSRMRQRNEGTQEKTEDGEDAGTAADPEAFKLITDIRNFIMFECDLIGEATTDEILTEFGPKLPKADSVKFKAMLQEICDYDKKHGVGCWRVRNEFR
ncbi:DNA excision repair protein ERCC-6-like [Mizuhopecten yessoensis]|uniref:DNA excision repair protein ERCC-6 n=2 Tax=Mizuhopecten yessoensis TaxID=6573 RepID=A0A210Q733_MIZYE|nr:DNA excision repair protein ERCC-6-like [Mizuhopecten yessoensis]OWF44499.1 DNA excision repair protein ERCC-6 [Mizuhopecten yessoensis]